MKLLFTWILLMARLAGIICVLKALVIALDVASLFVFMPVASGMTNFEYFRSNDGFLMLMKILGYGVLGAVFAQTSFRIAAWLVPAAVAQCTACGHPLSTSADSAAPSQTRTLPICPECGCRQPS